MVVFLWKVRGQTRSQTEEYVVSNPNSGPPPVNGTPAQLPGGLQYIDVVAGSGDEARPGQNVSVHYTGWLTTGAKFDSSRDRGRSLTFRLDPGSVIQGWVEGVAGMRVGGQRRLIIPPEMGYGSQGYPPVIPPNATLIFDVELLGIG
jgi:FKBP-type peptidyl-prolyl cis-trans isomerase